MVIPNFEKMLILYGFIWVHRLMGRRMLYISMERILHRRDSKVDWCVEECFVAFHKEKGRAP